MSMERSCTKGLGSSAAADQEISSKPSYIKATINKENRRHNKSNSISQSTGIPFGLSDTPHTPELVPNLMRDEEWQKQIDWQKRIDALGGHFIDEVPPLSDLEEDNELDLTVQPHKNPEEPKRDWFDKMERKYEDWVNRRFIKPYGKWSYFVCILSVITVLFFVVMGLGIGISKLVPDYQPKVRQRRDLSSEHDINKTAKLTIALPGSPTFLNCHHDGEFSIIQDTYMKWIVKPTSSVVTFTAIIQPKQRVTKSGILVMDLRFRPQDYSITVSEQDVSQTVVWRYEFDHIPPPQTVYIGNYNLNTQHLFNMKDMQITGADITNDCNIEGSAVCGDNNNCATTASIVNQPKVHYVKWCEDKPKQLIKGDRYELEYVLDNVQDNAAYMDTYYTYVINRAANNVIKNTFYKWDNISSLSLQHRILEPQSTVMTMAWNTIQKRTRITYKLLSTHLVSDSKSKRVILLLGPIPNIANDIEMEFDKMGQDVKCFNKPTLQTCMRYVIKHKGHMVRYFGPQCYKNQVVPSYDQTRVPSRIMDVVRLNQILTNTSSERFKWHNDIKAFYGTKYGLGSFPTPSADYVYITADRYLKPMDWNKGIIPFQYDQMNKAPNMDRVVIAKWQNTTNHTRIYTENPGVRFAYGWFANPDVYEQTLYRGSRHSSYVYYVEDFEIACDEAGLK